MGLKIKNYPKIIKGKYKFTPAVHRSFKLHLASMDEVQYGKREKIKTEFYPWMVKNEKRRMI